MRHFRAILLFLTINLIAIMLLAQAPQPHSVTLSWDPNPNPLVTSINIHRTATPGSAVIGTNYATVVPPVTTYKDTNVKSGDVWYYSLSAWCPTCSTKESGLGNEFKAVVPVDVIPVPDAPTGLKGVTQ